MECLFPITRIMCAFMRRRVQHVLCLLPGDYYTIVAVLQCYCKNLHTKQETTRYQQCFAHPLQLACFFTTRVMLWCSYSIILMVNVIFFRDNFTMELITYGDKITSNVK